MGQQVPRNDISSGGSCDEDATGSRCCLDLDLGRQRRKGYIMFNAGGVEVSWNYEVSPSICIHYRG